MAPCGTRWKTSTTARNDSHADEAVCSTAIHSGKTVTEGSLAARKLIIPCMEPVSGIEPLTRALRMRCSTPELHRRIITGLGIRHERFKRLIGAVSSGLGRIPMALMALA